MQKTGLVKKTLFLTDPLLVQVIQHSSKIVDLLWYLVLLVTIAPKILYLIDAIQLSVVRTFYPSIPSWVVYKWYKWFLSVFSVRALMKFNQSEGVQTSDQDAIRSRTDLRISVM